MPVIPNSGPAPVVKIDSIQTLKAEEKFGVVHSLTRLVHVSGIVADDYSILVKALDNAGVPAYGDRLDDAPMVRLVNRSVELVDSDKVDVTLQYAHFFDVPQLLNDPFIAGCIFGEHRSSCGQVTSNKDAEGNLITVSHTYSDDSDDGDPEFGGLTKTQTGEIQDEIVQREVVYNILVETNSPSALRASIIGKLNSVEWLGEAPRTWKCADCRFTPVEVLLPEARYLFTICFQNNPDGWDPTAVFIDERTGRPPAGLVAGVGYKTIQKAEAVDFEEELQCILL